jgi:hypothetical protein
MAKCSSRSFGSKWKFLLLLLLLLLLPAGPG